jgi:hypothetical protein
MSKNLFENILTTRYIHSGHGCYTCQENVNSYSNEIYDVQIMLCSNCENAIRFYQHPYIIIAIAYFNKKVYDEQKQILKTLLMLHNRKKQYMTKWIFKDIMWSVLTHLLRDGWIKSKIEEMNTLLLECDERDMNHYAFDRIIIRALKDLEMPIDKKYTPNKRSNKLSSIYLSRKQKYSN